MANSLSAKKRARQATKHRAHNAARRSMLRTAIKRVLRAIADKDLESARAAYAKAVPLIDRMARQELIHKSKGARHKSRLNAHIKALSTA